MIHSSFWVSLFALVLQMGMSEDPVVSFPPTLIAEYTTVAHQISEVCSLHCCLYCSRMTILLESSIINSIMIEMLEVHALNMRMKMESISN